MLFLNMWSFALYGVLHFRPHSRIVVGLMKLGGFLLILFFFAIPAFIKIYPAIIVELVFLNKGMHFLC